MSTPADKQAPESTDDAPARTLAPTLALPSRDDSADGPQARTDAEPVESVRDCTVPGYELLGELGRGAMGVVYKARQTAANRVVALKMILSGARAGAEERARFKAEAEAAARLQHPNIVQIFEVGEQHGQAYFSLEYCPRGTLEQKLSGAPVPGQEAAALLEKLARAMEHAHRHGVLHRDLKPANILLTSGEGIHPPEEGPGRRDGPLAGMIPKIADFGLAKRLDEAGQTYSGAIVGTPSYMSPEQAEGLGRALGPACDVYALGAVLYVCITGRPPFRAAALMDTLRQVIHDDPVPPRQLQPTCPRDLETICLKCLRKEPARRYVSALELADDLGRFQRGEPVRARPVSQLERGWRWCRRNRTTASLLLAVAAALLAGTAVSLGLYFHARIQERLAVEGFNRTREKEEEAQKSEWAQKKAAEEARRLAEQERTRREKAEYLGRIRMAEQLWLAGSMAEAREALDQTNPAHRGWEFGHLYNALHAPECTLLGHTDSVTGAAFSPDGRRIVSASRDRTVKVWDAVGGQELLTLSGYAGPVRAAEFSPDGTRIVSAGDDKTLRVWDAHSALGLRTLTGHTSYVTSVRFSPDGKRILSGSQDQSLKVWDAASGKLLATLGGPRDFINSVAFSPDGQRILAGIGYPGKSSSIVFSPGGKRVVSRRTDYPLPLFDAASGKELRAFRGHAGYISSAVFSPDGKRIASGSAEGTVKVWDALGGQSSLTLRGHAGFVYSVHFSPDGKRIVSAGEDRTLKVWRADAGQEVLHFTGHTGEFTSLSFSPDGKRILSANRDKTLKVWDTDSGEELVTLAGHKDFVNAAAFSTDGKRIASGSRDKSVKVWGADTGRELRTLNGHTAEVTQVSFSPDGRRIVSGSQDDTLRVWDADSGRELQTFKGHAGYVSSVVFSPDGRRIVSGSGDKTIKVWDAADGGLIHTAGGHAGPVRSVSFSSDGRRLVSASEDRTLKVWSAEGWQELQTLKSHTNSVVSAQFSPDGKRIVSGSWDHTLKVWDADSGQDLLTLRGHSSAVESLAIQPDGRRIISGGWDGVLKVWDDVRGQEFLVFNGHTANVTSAAFSSDGKRVVSTDSRGVTLVWETETGRVIPEARDQAREGPAVSPDGRLIAHRDGAAIRLLFRDSRGGSPSLRLLARPDPLWHLEQARDSERQADWFGASFHYGRLLALHPWSASAHAGRAFALAQRGRSGEAAAHYLQAAAWSPHAAFWPISPGANQPAHAAAETGDWPRAASLFLLAAHQPSASLQVWEGLVLAQQAAGQAAAGRRSCSELLSRFGSDKDARLVWQAAFACRVLPLDEADAVQWARNVERLAPGNRSASNLDLLGSLHYRAGRHEAAARLLEDAIREQGGGGFVDSWLFLAMARQKLGQSEEARRLLVGFEGWLNEQHLKSWQEKVRWQLLHEEAKDLIVTMPKVPQED